MPRPIPEVAREIEAVDLVLADYVEERRTGMFLQNADHDLITDLMRQRNDLVDEITDILSDALPLQSEPGEVLFVNDLHELSVGGETSSSRRAFGHVISTSFSEPQSGRALRIVVYDARSTRD